MLSVPRILTRTVARTGAQAASIGSAVLDLAAQKLRSVGGEDEPGNGSRGSTASRPERAPERAPDGGPATFGEDTPKISDAVDVPVRRASETAERRLQPVRNAGADAATTDVDATANAPQSSRQRRTPARSTAKAKDATAGPAPRRISNPKAAAKVRKRQARADSEAAAKADTKGTSKAVGGVEVGGAKGKGGTPATLAAENTPKERAQSKAGREPAPMGAEDKAGS